MIRVEMNIEGRAKLFLFLSKHTNLKSLSPIFILSLVCVHIMESADLHLLNKLENLPGQSVYKMCTLCLFDCWSVDLEYGKMHGKCSSAMNNDLVSEKPRHNWGKAVNYYGFG